MSGPSTSQRSHRRTSIRLPTARHQHRHPSPPPPKQPCLVPRRHPRPEPESGSYTLARPHEMRSDRCQPDRDDDPIALYGRNHEHSLRRPRARTVAATPDIDVRSSRARVRSGSLSSSPLDHPQLRPACPAIAVSSRACLPPVSRKHDRRKQSTRRMTVRRDSGYESDDADDDTVYEENAQYAHPERNNSTRMAIPSNLSGAPSGRFAIRYSGQTSLLRPDSPSNDSSASTDDDYIPANADPHALEYYLGNDDTWRDAEIVSQSSEESELSDDDQAVGRYFNDSRYPDGKLFSVHSSQLPNTTHSDMGTYSYTDIQRRQRRSDRPPHLPKRVPLVPSCSKSRKRASMRAAWKMRFGRLFQSDSEAETEVEDELDWEGYESADARRIVAMRIQKAGGGDGRKAMEGKEQLAELLVKKPIDPRRLAGRVSRRRRADTVRGRERADTAATVQPALGVDTCPTCASPVVSPSMSTRTITTSTESPVSSTLAFLPTPTSSPPTSVASTPCPSCAQLSPRGDALGLVSSPPTRLKALSPRSPPCKTTPLHAGTDPLTVFAVAVEQEKQRDFSGLLKRSPPPPQSMFTGLVRGVRTLFGRFNNLVDLAAGASFTTAVEGTCPLSPVMGAGGAIVRDISTRRRANTMPSISSTAVRSQSQRRRSYLRSCPQPGAPTSPYGYRVRPQEVAAAFPTHPGSDALSSNVAVTPIPSDPVLPGATGAVELKDVPPRSEADAPAPAVDLKGLPAANTEARRRRTSRSPSRRRTKRSAKANSAEKPPHLVELEAHRDEMTRSRAVIDSKYWRVLAGEMEQRRRGGVEVAFMVRLAVEEGRNLPIFTSEEQQAATGEIVVGGVWKASLARWRIGGIGKGQTRIRSGLINEVFTQSEASDTVSDSSSSL